LPARARIELIHHGDAGFLQGEQRPDRSAARAALGLPADAKLVLVFGAIRPYKGIHGVIAALPELRRRHAAARW
jgi:glycosyltransferase involved in cell wall biosynthesis